VSGLNLQLDDSALSPLVAAVTEKVLAVLEANRAIVNGAKVAYAEAEAARMLSMNYHQLRDERVRGRILASVGPGRKILYCREDLLRYLAARRWEPGGVK
jgi:hypothetical protein